MPKRQVLEDEILAGVEGRLEWLCENGDDLEHRAESARDHCGASTIPWVDEVLAKDKGSQLEVSWRLAASVPWRFRGDVSRA